MFLQFLRCRHGNFALAFAILLPTLLAAVGLAIDVSRLSEARVHLQGALDAALLAASRLKDAEADREQVFDSVLAANLVNDPSIISYTASLEVIKGASTIETQGTVTGRVKLLFLHTIPSMGDVKVQASAGESSDDLEVAMVLDNTGSMGSDGMKALREAALAMVDILESVKSPDRDVRAALVPFVTAVNVKGTGYKDSWIDLNAKAPLNGANFELKNNGKPYNHLDLFKALGVAWKGCVEARPAPYNLDDTPPKKSNRATLFVPYFAPDNPGAAAKSPNSPSGWNNSYLGDSIGKTERDKQRQVARYLDASTPRYIDEKSTRTTGPNYACATPIEPLTTDYEKLRTAINAMIHWEGSGTNVSEGLAWGMRVLSPEEPYTQGKKFGSPDVTKSLVMFTDGENNVFGASGEAFNTSDYGAYGFLDSGRVGTSNRADALAMVDTWTQTMCTRLKDKGVEIYTVLLGADTKANRDLYSQCASTPANYFPTKDLSELRLIFQKIASRMTKLQLTQ